MPTAPPDKFIFCHIPKSGGTTMGKILERNFGAGFYPYYGLWDRYMFEAADVAGMCDLHPQYTCLASHLFSLDLPYDSPRFTFRAFSFLRHPVERALSLYFYSFRMARENPGYQPPGSIEEFFAPILDKKTDGRFFDGQMQFLSNQKPAAWPLEKIDRLMAEQRVLLAPCERFDDACLLLEHRFPHAFRNAAYGRSRNRSDRREPVKEDLRQRLAEANPRDMDLYAMVCDRFAAAVREELGEGPVLEAKRHDFTERCRRQALHDKWAERAWKLRQKIGERLRQRV
jgi:hypothetical protein